MLKNKSKMLVAILAVMLLISTVSFATDTDNVAPISETNVNQITATSEENPTNEANNASAITQADIYNGDLYIFDNDIIMDKLVDGNVFLIGQNVEITGKVNGSLYVLANNVTVSEDSYIVQSLYVCANKLTLNGAANDLYAFCNKVELTHSSFIIRDLRVAASTFNFAGGVGRDAFVGVDNFTFANEGENAAIVYGNLDYSSTNELTLSKELVNGDIHYTKPEVNSEDSVTDIIMEKLLNLCQTIVYTAIVFLLILWLAPNFAKKSSSYIDVKNTPISFGIGLLGFIASVVGCFILLISNVCAPVAVSIFGIFALMMAISFAITVICISYKLKEKFELKNNLFVVVLLLVSIVIWALELIPYVGGIIGVIVSLFGFGTILSYIFTNNKIKISKKTDNAVKDEK